MHLLVSLRGTIRYPPSVNEHNGTGSIGAGAYTSLIAYIFTWFKVLSLFLFFLNHFGFQFVLFDLLLLHDFLLSFILMFSFSTFFQLRWFFLPSQCSILCDLLLWSFQLTSQPFYLFFHFFSFVDELLFLPSLGLQLSFCLDNDFISFI